jgi:hypothetical protein
LRVVEALERYARDLAPRADHATPDWAEQRERTRGKLAALIGADADEIAMVKNTPDALSMVAAGLRWRSGDRVVTCDQEFPANVLPWLNLAERGVEVTLVPSREGRVLTEDIVSAIDDRTRLVALSWVEFSTGYRNDLTTIGRACGERGARALGRRHPGVARSRWTCGCSASTSWRSRRTNGCSPLGSAGFYCRREVPAAGRPGHDRGRRAVTGRTPARLLTDFCRDARRFGKRAPTTPGCRQPRPRSTSLPRWG